MDAMDSTTIDEASAMGRLLSSLHKEKTFKYNKVVTTGRGGLSVAQKVAYALKLDFALVSKEDLQYIPKGHLFVDDIVCTGNTLMRLPDGIDSAVLVRRIRAKKQPTFAGHVVTHNKYIRFSWEM